MSAKTLKLIEENDVKWVDLRFTDTRGKEQHVTFPADKVDADFFEGQMFDGSSVAGWKSINESDMILKPDDDTAVLDPFGDDRPGVAAEERQTEGEAWKIEIHAARDRDDAAERARHHPERIAGPHPGGDDPARNPHQDVENDRRQGGG